MQRSSDSGATWSILSTNLAQTSYQDKTVAAGTSYQYEVIATNVGGSSPASNPVTVSAQSITPPNAPTILTIASPASNEIDLTWSAPSGASSYTVMRSSDHGATWSTVAASLAQAAYADKTVAANTSYQYEIIAVNAGGSSPASAAATVSSLPTFSSQDIGATNTGSTTTLADDSSYDVTAGGTGIYNNADSFRFVSTQVTGNFDIAVQVAGISDTGIAGTYPQAGLMARASLDACQPGSSHHRQPRGWIPFQVPGDVGSGYHSDSDPNIRQCRFPKRVASPATRRQRLHDLLQHDWHKQFVGQAGKRNDEHPLGNNAHLCGNGRCFQHRFGNHRRAVPKFHGGMTGCRVRGCGEFDLQHRLRAATVPYFAFAEASCDSWDARNRVAFSRIFRGISCL